VQWVMHDRATAAYNSWRCTGRGYTRAACHPATHMHPKVHNASLYTCVRLTHHIHPRSSVPPKAAPAHHSTTHEIHGAMTQLVSQTYTATYTHLPGQDSTQAAAQAPDDVVRSNSWDTSQVLGSPSVAPHPSSLTAAVRCRAPPMAQRSKAASSQPRTLMSR
jgi:hypothetical protein